MVKNFIIMSALESRVRMAKDLQMMEEYRKSCSDNSYENIGRLS